MNTVLRPPWIHLSRFAWLVMAAASLILSGAGLLRAINEPLPACTAPDSACAPWVVSREDLLLADREGIPRGWLTTVYFFGGIFPKITFGLVGILIFWRRSQDWVAQMLSLMLVLFALEGVANLGVYQPIADVLYGLTTLLFSVLPFIFPNGRFEPGWTVYLAVPLALLSTTTIFLPSLGVSISEAAYAWLILSPFFLWTILAGYSVIYRYRFISIPVEQQQIKWAMAGLLASFILLIPFVLISLFFPPSQPSVERNLFLVFVHYPLYMISYLAIPGGIAFAILRYRLWSIDIIIRRTLQYSLLTGVLALIYFGGVVFLQQFLGLVTGDNNSPLVTVLTTLGVAALFNPLRTRIQNGIDRRFFRARYDASQALDVFSQTVRNEVELNRLAESLLEVVTTTVQPEKAELYLVGRQK